MKDGQHDKSIMPPRITTLDYVGRRAETDAVYARLPEMSRLVLRQFSLERLIGYGVAHADAIELRAAVLDGADWLMSASRLANTVMTQARGANASIPTRIAALYRASALLRMAQVMMSADTDERRDIYARAASLFGEAATLSGRSAAVVIDTATGPLAGWLYSARTPAVGSAIVIGGVEGWAMDFASQGEALAARGMDALMLDGPGQGESRFRHRHYFNSDWIGAYRGAIDHMARRSPGHRIAFIGNSLGGSLAMTIAAADPRVRACCSNCGIVQPTPAPDAAGTSHDQRRPVPGNSLFLDKMLLASGTDDLNVARTAWTKIAPVTPVSNNDYALLIVHGGKDMAVPHSAADTLLTQSPTFRKEMVVFSDGDHCIYNHRDDRDAIISDWIVMNLT